MLRLRDVIPRLLPHLADQGFERRFSEAAVRVRRDHARDGLDKPAAALALSKRGNAELLDGNDLPPLRDRKAAPPPRRRDP